MRNHDGRLSKLEKRTPAANRRVIVAYAEKTDPAELAALRNDPGVTLLVVEYIDRQPKHHTPTLYGDCNE